jgi:hypothetical protein
LFRTNGFNSYKQFLLLAGFSWNDKYEMPPLSEDSLIHYATHCHKHLNIKCSTIKLYSSAAGAAALNVWKLKRDKALAITFLTPGICLQWIIKLFRTDSHVNVRISFIISAIVDLFSWNDKYEMPPLSEDSLIHYATHCHKHLNLKCSTIKLYICGIRYKFLQSYSFL